ncbi:hypothetical protein AGMMS49938_15440 [Fibrobacterales bacterium]|nr:hypothetical protein AGMMS49938_15440 [Fibrobacterales bacterium]
MAKSHQHSSIQLLEINLLPAEHKRKKFDLSWLSDARVIWSSFALFIVAVVLFLLYVHIESTVGDLQAIVEQTKAAAEKERPLLKKIEELDQKVALIASKSKALKSIQVSRKRWVILFEDLSTALPAGTWITGVNQAGTQLDIGCVTWSFSDVALYMLKLEQKVSITDVSLTNISASKINGEDAYNFSLKVGFNENLGMEDGIR